MRKAQGSGLSYALLATPWGVMGVVASRRGLKKVILPQPDEGAALRQIDGEAQEADFGDLPFRLKSCLAGREMGFPEPLDLSGSTSFQRQVWQVVGSIPYGQTRSYQWVAEQLGKPRGARAVGQALAANPLPLLIPCHRVVGAKGLGGFSGGLALKRWLLEMEREGASGQVTPAKLKTRPRKN